MQVEKKLLSRKNKIRHSEGCERHFKTLSTFTVSLYEHTLKEQRSFSKVPRVKILFQLMLHFTEYLLLSYPTRKISIIVQISELFVYFST